jgi:hypothetical protein
MIPKGMTIGMLENQITDGASGLNELTINEDLGVSVGQSTNIIADPKTKEITYPTLGLNPDIKPIKSTDTTIQGGLYPDCLRKWEEYSSVVKFGSNEEMENSKKEFMTKCMSTSTVGASQIVEPEVVTPIKDTTSETSSGSTTNNVVLPNLGAFLGSLTGGAGGGAGAIEETATIEKKKPFPYWLIVVAVVGGYLIFRKK